MKPLIFSILALSTLIITPAMAADEHCVSHITLGGKVYCVTPESPAPTTLSDFAAPVDEANGPNEPNGATFAPVEPLNDSDCYQHLNHHPECIRLGAEAPADFRPMAQGDTHVTVRYSRDGSYATRRYVAECSYNGCRWRDTTAGGYGSYYLPPNYVPCNATSFLQSLGCALGGSIVYGIQRETVRTRYGYDSHDPCNHDRRYYYDPNRRHC